MLAAFSTVFSTPPAADTWGPIFQGPSERFGKSARVYSTAAAFLRAFFGFFVGAASATSSDKTVRSEESGEGLRARFLVLFAFLSAAPGAEALSA